MPRRWIALVMLCRCGNGRIRRLAVTMEEPEFRPHHDNSVPLIKLLKLCASAAKQS